MIKCEVINQDVTIKDWKKLKNIKRIKSNDEIIEPNYFEIGDKFETDEEMASYLAGETPKQPIVCIKILEVVPEEIKTVAKKTKKVK